MATETYRPRRIEVSSSFRDSVRSDGRMGGDLRPIFMKLDVVANSAGSAFVEFPETKIVCAVYGPKHPTQQQQSYSDRGRLFVDAKFAPFAQEQRRKRGGQDADERVLSQQLHDALSVSIQLDRLPKSNVEVFVTVIEGRHSQHDCMSK